MNNDNFLVHKRGCKKIGGEGSNPSQYLFILYVSVDEFFVTSKLSL